MGNTVESKVYDGPHPSIENLQISQRRHQMMEQVETFVVNVYATCPRVEAMWLVLSSKLGQKAFQSFMRAKCNEDCLTLFITISEILISREFSTAESLKIFLRIKDKLLNSTSDLSNQIPILLKNEFLIDPEKDPDFDPSPTTLIKILERLQNELVFLLAKDHFTEFLNSKNYKNWRATESSHAVATTFEDASISTAASFFSYSRFSSLKSLNSSIKSPASHQLRQKMKSVVQPTDLLVTAFSNMRGSEMLELLNRRDSWLAALLTAVEALPICFSLASGSLNNPGFPVIYANRYFEKVTGFTRDDIIGKRYREFLQCNDTEPHKRDQLAEALRTQQSAVVVLTNQMADGRRFKNLVAIKPVLNDASTPSILYVMALHFDVSREVDHYVSKVNLATQLLEMLPTVLWSAEDVLSGGDGMDSEWSDKQSTPTTTATNHHHHHPTQHSSNNNITNHSNKSVGSNASHRSNNNNNRSQSSLLASRIDEDDYVSSANDNEVNNNTTAPQSKVCTIS
jgi:PAS domain S-box-containing protein